MNTDLNQTKIASELRVLQNRNISGILSVKHDKPGVQDWHLYIYLGRLTYATGGGHAVRRWVRALRQYATMSNFDRDWLSSLTDVSNPWEMDIVTRAVIQGKMTSDQAKQVIQANIREVFLTLSDQRVTETSWQEMEHSFRPLVVISADQIVQNISQSRQKWHEAGLSHVQNMIPNFSFELTPVVKDPDRLQQVISTGAFQSAEKLISGKNTLWDLSVVMQKSMISVMRSLLPLVLDGIVEFKEIPDLPLPFQASQPNKAASGSQQKRPATESKGVIACIDDSPQIGQTMAALLAPYGYETIVITDPLQGVSTLLQKKPDLIFLDLVMPNTNGYELCTFLRKTSQFQEIPIVILTGHDSVVDRVRAKLAGSTDFVSKPPEEEKVVQIVQKYLKK